MIAAGPYWDASLHLSLVHSSQTSARCPLMLQAAVTSDLLLTQCRLIKFGLFFVAENIWLDYNFARSNELFFCIYTTTRYTALSSMKILSSKISHAVFAFKNALQKLLCYLYSLMLFYWCGMENDIIRTKLVWCDYTDRS